MALRFLAILLASVHAIAATAAEEKVLNVYNWNDYISERALKTFSEKTGIRVNYDVYDSNDILEAKLVAGKSGYDVVFPSATPYFAKQIKAGVYRKLDRAKITNFSRLDARVMAELKVADPEVAYGVPYMMAGTGVGYNIDKVRALMPDAPIGSVAMLFDPKVVEKLAPCGVTVLDGGDEVFAAALAFLGRNPASTSLDDLKAAADTVAKVRPRYRYVHSSSYINDLANGAICVAHGYAGDLVQARERAREAGKGVTVDIFLPREGAAFNIDVAAIPADAPHPENAHLFIDHLLTPEIIADITSSIGYANAVPDSKPLVIERVRNDKIVFPPAETRLFAMPLVTPQFERERNRAWTRVRAAR
jgi:putrescine transport system substrate-binding protein